MPNARRDRLLGVTLVLLSAIAWSLNGLYTRFLTVDVWTTLVGRGIATSGMLLAALLVIHRGNAGRMIAGNARHGFVVIACGAVCMITFVAALFHTSVANVTVIYSISPLMAAVLALIVIGDPLRARTLVAFTAALAGIVLMVGASFGTARLFGDFLALVMSVSFAVLIVEMRRKPGIDNLTTALLTSVLTILVCLPLASLGTVTAVDAIVLFLFGFTSNVLGFFFFIAGVRRMPPAEAGLIATIEIVLAPFWVWLFFAEDPGQATVIGGAIVLAAIFFQLYGELRRARSENLAAKVETAPQVL